MSEQTVWSNVMKVMYLPLAKKMLDKFVKENKMTALAELIS